MIRLAAVAQLDRVIGYEPIGRGFESLPLHHIETWMSFLIHVRL